MPTNVCAQQWFSMQRDSCSIFIVMICYVSLWLVDTSTLFLHYKVPGDDSITAIILRDKAVVL